MCCLKSGMPLVQSHWDYFKETKCGLKKWKVGAWKASLGGESKTMIVFVFRKVKKGMASELVRSNMQQEHVDKAKGQ